MSAVVALVDQLGRSVHLFTDGAVFDSKGRVTGNLNKARLLPHLNAAFAVRGPVPVGQALEEVAGGYSTFQDLADDLGPALRKAVRKVARRTAPLLPRALTYRLAPYRPDRCDVLLVGVGARGPEVYHGVGAGNVLGEPAEKPWTASRQEGGGLRFASPTSDEMEQRIPARLFEAPGSDPAGDGLGLMCLQRSVLEPFPRTATKLPMVGLFCQLTSVSVRGITTRVLHRWPDEIGSAVGGAS